MKYIHAAASRRHGKRSKLKMPPIFHHYITQNEANPKMAKMGVEALFATRLTRIDEISPEKCGELAFLASLKVTDRRKRQRRRCTRKQSNLSKT